MHGEVPPKASKPAATNQCHEPGRPTFVPNPQPAIQEVGAKLPVTSGTGPDSLDTSPDYPLLTGPGRVVWTENVGLLIRRFWVQVPGGVPLVRPLTKHSRWATTTGPRVPKWVPSSLR